MDQPVHNWLWYTRHGYADEAEADARSIKGSDKLPRSAQGLRRRRKVPYQGRAMRFGVGPVQTVGRLCSMAEKEKERLVKGGQWGAARAPEEDEKLLRRRWNISLADDGGGGGGEGSGGGGGGGVKEGRSFFLNLDGKAAPVVHQVDRCWSLWAGRTGPLDSYCRDAHAALRRGPGGSAVRPDHEVCKGS